MKRTLVILTALCIIALQGVAFADTGGPGDAGIFHTTLANGLRVVVVEDRAAPVVQTGVWYRFGSLEETPGKTGLAHALEHMMFRGTSNISSGGLDDIVTRMGAQMNGETNYDYTQFYFEMPEDKLDVALYIESDRMQHLLLRESDWRIERGAVLNELEGDAGSPFFDLLKRVRAAAFPNQPAGRVPIGHKADVERATASDIAKYYHEWYAPNNATLVVAGDVNHEVVFAKARKYFGAIPARTLPKHVDARPIPSSGAVVQSTLPFPFEVLDLAYSVPGDTEPGEPAISTLATLIENQRGPFYQALVQTNVALAVQADSDTQLKGGLLNVFIVLNPGHHGDEAQRIFQNTMDAQLRDGFSPGIVKAAQRLTIAERLFSADSIDGIGDLAGYTYGIVGEKIQDEDARLAALTPAAILAAAKTYLSKPTVVGHLLPNAGQPSGSQKSSAAITDDFSKRVPNGPIIEPGWVRAAVRKPTTARSVLMPTAFTLPNGVHVIVQQKTDRQTFTLSGEIAASPAFAPPGKEGIIRLASAVADYGSQAYPFALRHKTTDDLGAFVSTGQDFSARGLAGDFDTIARVIADGEEHPTFAEPWFSLEREQLANSLQSEASISGVMIDRVYARLLESPNDPSLREATSASVNSITRDDLLAYAKTYWRPDLTTIAVVGDVTPAHVRAVLTAAFADWHAQGPTPNVHSEAFPPAQAGHDYVGTDTNQVYVRLGQAALSRTNKDYDTFLVLNQILGASGAFESRLWQGLRQTRGLVYSVGSSLSADADRGDFRIELSAPPDHVVEAVRFIRDELHRLQTQPVTETELTEAKGRLVSGALLAEASADGQVGQLMDIATNGLPLDYYRTLNERFARITPADVERVAKTYLHPNRLIQVYAGPAGPWETQSL
ncbi:MAG: M16 family metallopeptidase [Vulcanimicrobiaceae bacterium]